MYYESTCKRRFVTNRIFWRGTTPQPEGIDARSVDLALREDHHDISTRLVLASALPVVVRIDAVKQRIMFMRNVIDLIVSFFGVFFPFVKRPKNPRQFIIQDGEIYEYDSESRQYHPWKSSGRKR